MVTSPHSSPPAPTITAHHDFELNSTIPREINYSICFPEGDIDGLVLYIAGFGADAGSYRENFQQHISDMYSMACLTVDYHCFHARPNTGGDVYIEPHVLNLLRSITGCVNNETIDDVLLTAEKMRANKQILLKVPGIIIPEKNGYQNFGLLPAVDNIYALNDVFLKYSKIPKKIFSVGSSYGGYIANLISKIAPSTLNAVFDNSSWAVPNLEYVVGHETGNSELSAVYSQGTHFELNVLSPWSHFTCMPNCFDKNKCMMRSFPENHIEIMSKAGKNKTIYRFIHAENDLIANTKQKTDMANTLEKKGSTSK